jgi:uncharacterized membrane protein HdeD (DUF308 family)
MGQPQVLPGSFKNTERTVSFVGWGIAVAGILMIFLPLSLGMDGFNGGFALAFSGILVCIIGISIGALYLVRARAVSRMFSGKDILVNWLYSREQWQSYAREAYREGKSTRWGVFAVLAVISLVIGIIFAVLDPEAGLWVLFTLLGILALIAIVIAVANEFTRRRNRGSTGEVFIARDGVYLNGALHRWQDLGSRLEGVAYEKEKPYAYINFTYSGPAPRGRGAIGRQTATVRVPVPEGEEAAAQKIVVYFNEQVINSSPGFPFPPMPLP